MTSPSQKSLQSKSSKPSAASVSQSVGKITNDEVDVFDSTSPVFIYGGPFIHIEKPSPLLDTATPINLQLQGTFKKSYAYYSLKERMPVILTKIIDYCSREGGKVKSSGANDGDVREYIHFVGKLKQDLITNKKYELLKEETPDAKKWNEWIEASPNQYYFTNTWVFTECYIYRRLREGCEIYKSLTNFDPFQEQKSKAFTNSLEPMCVVADKLMTMLPESDKDKRKADFIALIKICLWANKCDLSLSMGEEVTLTGSESANSLVDPFQMIIDLKDKVLVDDSAKAADQIVTKAENVAKAIEGNTTFKYQCSCHRLAKLAGMPICTEPESGPTPVGSKTAAAPAPAPAPAEGDEEPEAPKIPCPAKMTIPQATMFDIVCDNAGYELFADLCLAHFVVSQKIVQKVRFHVKNIPWFVSDVTPKDFNYVIDQCRAANFNKSVAPEPKSDAEEGAPAPEPIVVGADNLRRLGDQWSQYVADGTFIVMKNTFWTSPHTYKDMKKYDYNLYRKLQMAVAIMFKGDLNYRKLLGERNCNPVLGFEPALQGFIPAPILAVRTVKAELICGMPKGKWEQITKIDEKWMQKGDYGVIHFCPKAEPLKVSEKPCLDYGDECFGKICPIHTDL